MNHFQFWSSVAAYYRIRLDDFTINLYAIDVKHLTVDQLLVLFAEYRKNPNHKTMPMPAWFIEQLNPVHVDPRDQAREISSRVHGAITRYGWCNAEEARDYIGSVGWKVVERYGGWETVCQIVGSEIDAGVFLAQTRDLAESMIKTQASPNFDQPINFLEHNNFNKLIASKDLVKTIETKKKN